MNSFRKEILKLNNHRTHKISNSLGVYDAYKWLRKNKWLNVGILSEHNYYSIIRLVNKALITKFLTTGYIQFPERMGELLLKKYPSKIELINNKIQTNLPIDWDTTLKLWASDKEAYDNKTLIRLEEAEIFRVFYDKSKALYNNKSFYSFNLNRVVKLSLKRKLKEGVLDAFILCGKI